MVHILEQRQAKRVFGLQDISDCTSAEEVIEKLDIGDYTEEPIEGYAGKKGIRDDLGNGLAIVGSKYALAQPSDVIKRVDPIRENLGATFDQFGFLDEGRRFFLRCKMPNELEIDTPQGKDSQQARFSTMAGVDSTIKEIHSLDIWRELCSNGMMGWAKNVIAGVKHTVNFDRIVTQAIKESESLAEAFDSLQTKMQTWSNTEITKVQAKEIVNRVFPAQGEVTKRLENTRETVLGEFTNERRGAYGSTLYDLANAITAWNTHERTRKGEEDSTRRMIDGKLFSENRLLGLKDSEGLLERMEQNSNLILS